MKLNTKRTLFVGIIFFSISLFWQIYDSIIVKILDNNFNLSATKSGIVMAMDNVVALFMLPLFGSLSDKTKTRWGRRTPYIICGTILAAITFIFVALFADKRSIAPFLISLGFVLIFMSIYRSPAVALMPDVTVKPLRSKANAIINLMGALGGLISLGAIAALYKDNGNVLKLFSIVSGIMLLSLAVFLIFVKEPKLVDTMQLEKKNYGLNDEGENEGGEGSAAAELGAAKFKSMLFLLLSVFLWFMAYNAITTFFSRYSQRVWKIPDGNFALPLMIAQVSAIIMFVPVGKIASKIGRKKTILWGIAAMITAFIIAAVFGSNLFGINVDLSDGFMSNPLFYLLLLPFILTGAGWATINVNSYPMVVEMSKDANAGKYTGYYYTASMTAQIVTPILAGVFLDINEKVLFVYSLIFIALAFVTMLKVMHGDSKPEAKISKLESFDTPD